MSTESKHVFVFDSKAGQTWPIKYEWVSITEKTKQKERDRFKYLPRWLYRAVSFFLFNTAHILNFNETHTLSSSSWNQMRRDEQQWTQTVCSSMAWVLFKKCKGVSKQQKVSFWSFSLMGTYDIWKPKKWRISMKIEWPHPFYRKHQFFLKNYPKAAKKSHFLRIVTTNLCQHSAFFVQMKFICLLLFYVLLGLCSVWAFNWCSVQEIGTM